jgi:hypothetical protein
MIWTFFDFSPSHAHVGQLLVLPQYGACLADRHGAIIANEAVAVGD